MASENRNKNSDMLERIGKAKELRGFRHDSELAIAAHLAPSAISDWHSGKTANPRRNSVAAVANALRVDLEWLLTGRGAGPSESEPEPNRVIRERAPAYGSSRYLLATDDELGEICVMYLRNRNWRAFDEAAAELRERDPT